MRLDRTQDPGLPMRRIHVNWRLVVKVLAAIVIVTLVGIAILALASGGYSTHS